MINVTSIFKCLSLVYLVNLIFVTSLIDNGNKPTETCRPKMKVKNNIKKKCSPHKYYGNLFVNYKVS